MLLRMRGVVTGDLRLLIGRLVVACPMGLGGCEMASGRLLQMFTGLLVVLLQSLVGSRCGRFGGCQCHGVLSELIKACS